MARKGEIIVTFINEPDRPNGSFNFGVMSQVELAKYLLLINKKHGHKK